MTFPNCTRNNLNTSNKNIPVEAVKTSHFGLYREYKSHCRIREKMPQLIFRNKKFILVKGNVESTLSIKEALQYKPLADKRAAEILNRAFVKHYSGPFEGLPLFLDSHQKEGVSWILSRSRSYLAHAPGAGKTCEAIVASMYATAMGHTVFIVPPSLTANWARETMKFWALTMTAMGLTTKNVWPSISVIPESVRQDYAGWGAEFIIIPDSMLTKPWVLESLIWLRKKFVAVDEASRFKDPESQRAIALFGGVLNDGRKSQGLVYDCKHAVLLDGSPMPNRPMELWAPTYAMSPESIDFMTREDFGFRYCGATMNDYGQWQFKNSSREEELRDLIQKDFMHVVTEEALNHPERLRSILLMTEDARSPAHKEWEKKSLPLIDFEDGVSEDLSQGEMASFRKELGLRKVEWVYSYVKSRLTEKSESVLLFAWHRDVVLELSQRFGKDYPHAVIMGGVKKEIREKAIADFQSGAIKLLLLNIGAAGRGYNLQRADRAVFAEFSWSDETNRQAEKRASRKGRGKDFPVRCDYVVSPNSMDEPILNAVFKKASRVKRIIG